MRERYADVPEPIGAGGWEYIDDRTIRLRPPGTRFDQGRLYELAYPARDRRWRGSASPPCATSSRSCVTPRRTKRGAPNPLAGSVAEVLTMGISQAARFLRDFVHLGFNADERGRRVFDGVLNWIGGASGGFFNYRFAQPFRTHRQHIARWFPEREFPFANHLLTDPVTGRSDGRLERCRTSGTCPRLMEANSANEYWVKGGLVAAHRSGRQRPCRIRPRSASTCSRACRTRRASVPAGSASAGSPGIRWWPTPDCARCSWRWTSG